GAYVTPQNSPVSPERFSGYHTGIDLEIFSNEAGIPVEARAVCGGTLLKKDYVSGYGGVAAQSCTLDGALITVLYGHLKLDSIALSVGDTISAGDFLGILGAGYTSETDGERKHLHLSFRRGEEIDLRGYAADKAELDNWIDPYPYIAVK
ncbi:MAG: M23 family metallopeptidase, partial [Patescibacteria group bacterium]